MHDAAESGASGRKLVVLDHPRVPQGEAEYVAKATDLDDLVAHVREVGTFAFDTEFIGEETFYPRTCLVQIGTHARCALVDPFEIDDLSPVWDLLLDPDITALVHDGAQDLEPVARATGREPAGIVDTQVAAAFCDMPWPASLAKTVQRFCGHALVKGHAFTQWDRRPLTTVQQRYAADDVRYLPLVWEVIRAQLEERGTLAWALAECAERPRTAGTFDPERQIKRIARGGKLSARAFTVLVELVEARHALAAKLDEPLRAVLPDDAVAAIARDKPGDAAALARCRGVSKRVAAAHGEHILAALQRGLTREPDAPPDISPVKESADDRQRIDAMYAALSLHCLARGISPQLIISRSDLAKWVITGQSAPLFPADTWRHTAAGAWLTDFLAGKAPLSVTWRDGRPIRF